MLVIIVSMTLIQFDLSFTHINEASYVQILWADFLFFLHFNEQLPTSLDSTYPEKAQILPKMATYL